MRQKKTVKEMATFLMKNGYEFDRFSNSSFEIYVHPEFGEYGISPSITDTTVKNEIRKIQKRMGLSTDRDASKRDAAAVRERQAKERQRLQEELDRKNAEIEARIVEIESREGRLGFTLAEWRQLSPVIERLWNERVAIERQMTEGPWNNRHEGRGVRAHVSGGA